MNDESADMAVRRRGRIRQVVHSRPVLLVAFAFAVMADPVSSVAYAIEAALRALHADLALLFVTLGLVVAVIALIIINYQLLVARFPDGGGAAAAAGAAFGEAWALVPIGALIVDFVLTISISAAAGASALIAYLPALAVWRVPLAVLLVAVVAALTWWGHLGRALFAVFTLAFVGASVAVLLYAVGASPRPVGTITAGVGHPVWTVLLAFPVAMALATGVEAPSSAIAQLGQLTDNGRRRFGQITLWLTLGIVGCLTLGLAAAADHLRIGVPDQDTTQIAELARAAAPAPVFAAFQLATAVLLLAAASSSLQAGPGLFKALARRRTSTGAVGILPEWLGRTNMHHTPYVGVAVFAVASGLVTAAAGGRDQELVLFYAVSVFVSFLVGLLAMVRFARRQRSTARLAIAAVGACAVVFTLAVNLTRVDALISIAASLLIAAALYRVWVRAGRPRGIASAVASAESTVTTDTYP